MLVREIERKVPRRANMEVPRRIRCLYCSSILLQLRDPVSPRNSSSFVTVALVARWRGSGGFGWSAGKV